MRALGGDVIVSFGGAANQEMAEVITDPVALQAAYQSIIDAYGLTHIDFDIEGAAVAQQGVDRSPQRCHRRLAAGRRGRGPHAGGFLYAAGVAHGPHGRWRLRAPVGRRAGVNLSIVNIMAMDYGDGAAPNPQGKDGRLRHPGRHQPVQSAQDGLWYGQDR